MLLVAMGYDSSIFEFTGADWEINVNRRANEAKLYEDVRSKGAIALAGNDVHAGAVLDVGAGPVAVDVAEHSAAGAAQS